MAAGVEYALRVDPVVAMRIAVAHALYWTWRGRLIEGGAALSAVLKAVPKPSPLRARALWARGFLLEHSASGPEAISLAQEAIELAERLGDPSTAARAYNVLGAMQMSTDPARAVTTFERGAKLAREAGDDWALGANLGDIGLAHVTQDREAEAMAAFEAAYPVNARMEYAQGLCWHWVGTSFFHRVTADRAGFRERAERCREMAAELGEPVVWGTASTELTVDDADHGRAESALRDASECVEKLVSAGAGLGLPSAMRGLAYTQAALGMVDEANSTLTALANLICELPAWSQWMYPDWVAVLRLAGELEKADAVASKALAAATVTGSPSCMASAKLARGRVVADRGEYATAEAEIHEAMALAERRCFPALLADALAALGVVAAGLQSNEEALRLLGASDRAMDDLDGRTRWKDDQAQLDELRERLEAELGPEPYAEGRELSLENAIGWARRARGERKRPERGWESLTPTELRVVELVAEGLTNPQIGERMFISRGTVKVHLSHIFAKLGTSTRAELAAEAARRASKEPELA